MLAPYVLQIKYLCAKSYFQEKICIYSLVINEISFILPMFVCIHVIGHSFQMHFNTGKGQLHGAFANTLNEACC